MAKLSRHDRTHFRPVRAAAWPLAHPAFVCPHAPNTAARPSVAVKGGSGVSPDYDNAPYLHAEEDKRDG
jgi:hypothetical protein